MQQRICECGHELLAHQLTEANSENPAPCAGCKEHYGYGGCRAGGFQNADTRYENLAYVFCAAESNVDNGGQIYSTGEQFPETSTGESGTTT